MAIYRYPGAKTTSLAYQSTATVTVQKSAAPKFDNNAVVTGAAPDNFQESKKLLRKRSSLQRRVTKQMYARGIHSFGDYLDYLEVHPEEFTPLFNTILINVTSFFRDEAAWTYLQHCPPEVLGSFEKPSSCCIFSQFIAFVPRPDRSTRLKQYF